MEWVKLYATPPFYLDGALLRAGEAAEVLFLRALAYSGNGDTRGLVDKTVLPLICPVRPQPRADALVREGLWLDEGLAYRIRSWDRHQEEHDAAAHKKQMDRERMRLKRAAARQDATSSSDTSATVADVSRDNLRQSRLEGEGDREREEEQPTTSVVAPARRATRIPESFPAEEDRERLAQWAAESAPAVSLVAETHNWQDWHRAKGDTAKDWNASWRTWMRRAQKDAEKRPGGALALVRPANPRVAEQDATLRRWMDEARGAGA